MDIFFNLGVFTFFSFKNTDWFDITDCKFSVSKNCNQEKYIQIIKVFKGFKRKTCAIWNENKSLCFVYI